MALRGYYLGCPGWGDPNWVGRLFPTGTKPADFLAHYARVFNTVEGNTSFYALPAPDLVRRWRDAVPDEFRFCWKFPKTISHDRRLVDAGPLVAEFLDRIAPLAGKLGTLMLQLPPTFDDRALDRLAAFLDHLPREHHYAVELRHAVFADAARATAHAMLAARGVDLVIMDARGLHAGTSAAFADVRARKPDLPIVVAATGARPIVRCVPHEVWDDAHVEPWVVQAAAWIAGGRTPYVFLHAPDDTFAPENAYRFHALLAARADVGELPPWPGGTPRQLGLW